MENFYTEMLLSYLNMSRNLKKLYDYEPKLSHSTDRENYYNDLKDFMKKTCKFFDIVTKVSTELKYEGRILFFLATKDPRQNIKIAELMRFLTKNSSRKLREKMDGATKDALDELEKKGLIIQDKTSKKRIKLNIEKHPELKLFNEIVSQSYHEKDEMFEVNNDSVDQSEGIKGIKRAIDARINELLENGEYDQALKEIDDFIDIYPKDVELYISKSEILNDELERYDEALEVVEKGLKIDNKEPYLYNNKATILFNKGELDKALDLIDIAIKFNGDADFLFKKSLWLLEKGLLFKALIEIERALEINSNYIEAREFKIELLERLESYEAVVLEYDKVIELDPNNDDHYINKSAVLNNNLEEYDLALEAVEKGLEINQKNPVLFENKAMILINKGKIEESIDAIDSALAIEENSETLSKKAYLLQEKAYTLKELEKNEEALKAIEKSIELFADFDSYIIQEECLFELKRYNEALEVIESAIPLADDDFILNDCLNDKASILAKLKRKEESKEIIQSLIEKEPDEAYYYDTFGEIYIWSKEFEEALKKFDKAIELLEKDDEIDPEQDFRHETYIKIGKCYLKLNKLDKAKDYLIKGKKLAEERNNRLWSDKATKYILKLEEYG